MKSGNHTINVFFLVVASASLSAIFGLFHYGFDLTDEGYYLLSIDQAENHTATITQFGALLNPLWLIAQRDLVMFRVIFWLLSCLAVVSLLHLQLKRQPMGSIGSIAVSLLLSCSLFCFLDIWLPTPSYNSLSLLILVVASYLLVFAEDISATVHAAGLGLVLMVAFLVKPPLLMGLLIVFGLFSFRRVHPLTKGSAFWFYWFQVFMFAMVGLLACCYVFLGSPSDFFLNLSVGIELSTELSNDRGFSISSIFWNGPTRWQEIDPWYLLLSLLLGGTMGGLLLCDYFFAHKSTDIRLRSLVFLGVTISILLYGYVGLLVSGQMSNFSNHLSAFEKTVYVFAIFLVIWLVVIIAALFSNNLSATMKARGWTTVSLASLSYVYLLGTSNNYYEILRLTVVFQVFAVVFFFQEKLSTRSFFVFGAYVLFLAALALPFADKSIYRQNSIDQIRSFPTTSSTVPELSAITQHRSSAEYFNEAVHKFNEAGFERGDVLLDLSGASPGLVFALGAKSPTVAWWIGGKEGSDRFVKRALNLFQLDGQQVWVIMENSPRAIDPKVLFAKGWELGRDFHKAGELYVPEGFGFRAKPSRQDIYRLVQN